MGATNYAHQYVSHYVVIQHFRMLSPGTSCSAAAPYNTLSHTKDLDLHWVQNWLNVEEYELLQSVRYRVSSQEL